MEQTTLLDTELGRNALDMAAENRIMKDFLITASASKNSGGKFTQSRENLQERAKNVLKELDTTFKYGTIQT